MIFLKFAVNKTYRHRESKLYIYQQQLQTSHLSVIDKLLFKKKTQTKHIQQKEDKK